MKKNQICKAEALIRWNSPKRGFVPPDDFIPLTKETGMIVEIGDWVLQQSIENVSNWRSNYQNRTPCEVIIVMAHKLNLYVIAEGVDTGLQKDILIKNK